MAEKHDLTKVQKLLIADKFLEDDRFDVNIVLDNGVAAKANKIVLAAKSKYLAAKLGILDELRLNVRASKASLDVVLKFFYTGQMCLELDIKELLILLNLLKFLEIENYNHVHAFTVSKIRENVSSNLKMVSNFKEVEYLVPNLLEMILTEFLHSRNDEKKEGSSNNNFTAEDHSQCFQIFFNWLQGNPDADFKFSKRISKMFDLRKFDNKMLLKEVRSSKMFTEEKIFDVLGNRDYELRLLRRDNCWQRSRNKVLNDKLLVKTSENKALEGSNNKLKRKLDMALFKRLSAYNAAVMKELDDVMKKRDDAMKQLGEARKQLDEARKQLDEAVTYQKHLNCRVMVKKLKLDNEDLGLGSDNDK